jgi:outer membrane protein
MTAVLLILLAQAAPGRVLTLGEAERVARERQPQLRVARAGTQAAEGRADQARSGLLPQLSATARYQRSTANAIPSPGLTSRSTGTTSFDTFNFFSNNVALTQLLWDFGQTSGRWRASQANAQATADQERATGLLVLLQVRSAFFTARANKALLAVARENLTNQRRHLDQIQGFVQAGTRPSIDLSQARADTANAAVQVINADNAYVTSKVTLNQAMGVEGPIDYEVSDDALPLLPEEDRELDPLLRQAFEARPDVASAEQQIRAQQLTLRSIQGGYGPTLSANAGLTQGGTSLDDLGWNLSAGVTLNWQLFQGGLTVAQVREAEANLASSVAQLDSLRQQVRLELDQARLAVRAAKASLNASKDALSAARERLQQAEARYVNGAGSVIELGDAQIAEATAGVQVVQADLGLATARAQLLKALGRP